MLVTILRRKTNDMDWKEKAICLLNNSLSLVSTEHNELDWKLGLSCKTARLAQHLCAFANLKGGGLLVYGVNDDGVPSPISKQEVDKIVNTLGNITHSNLMIQIQIEYDV